MYPPCTLQFSPVLTFCKTVVQYQNQNINIATVKIQKNFVNTAILYVAFYRHSHLHCTPMLSLTSGNLFYTIKFVILRMLCQWNSYCIQLCKWNHIFRIHFFPTQHSSLESHLDDFMYLFLFIVE